MQIDHSGISFIEEFEGCKLDVYLDVAGKPTIGIGHLIQPPETPEDYAEGITEAQAQALLFRDLAPVQSAVNRLKDPSCNQPQFNALCSFAFNLGTGSLQTMLAHGWSEVPVQMLKWVNAGGKPVAGLIRRRQAEAQMFTS